eukprot:UN32530
MAPSPSKFARLKIFLDHLKQQGENSPDVLILQEIFVFRMWYFVCFDYFKFLTEGLRDIGYEFITDGQTFSHEDPFSGLPFFGQNSGLLDSL